MAFFEWTDSLTVGIPIIDSDHRTLIDLINQMHEAIDAPDDGARRQIFETLFRYAERHFEREERLMVAGRYPSLSIHQRSHESFTTELMRRAHSGGDTRGLVEFLKDWLSQHILIQDMAYRPYLLANPEVERVRLSLGPTLADGLSTDETLEPAEDTQTLEDLVGSRTRDLLQTNAELEAAVNEAQAANRAKSLFLANMSHELRTPLHAILALSRLGIEKVDTSSKDRLLGYFTDIRRSGERLIGLLDNLLDLSKLEAGRMRFESEPIDLGKIVADVVLEFQTIAEERGLSLLLPRAPALASPTAMIQGDAVRIAQLTRNLISNALKFSETGGRIQVSVTETPPTGRDEAALVRLAVDDDGPGVPDGELEAIFDPFIQSSRSASGAGGTGLGLSICREIARAHAGEIWAEHRSPSGTRFVATFPGLAVHEQGR
ncbi:MAG: bacteriohemerythrin [Deltaproteobacteria bacterium]|nr:bacteriohemerythrin [Deltaproteobacteria bacterium]